MSNYTKSTNFATKDNLTPGDPLKIVRGTEIDTEFNNIATAIATKTDNASAAVTGGTINDTTIGATTASTGAFTTLAASGNVTLSGGTANGVAYLNGSKVVTSGSALVFDGSNLGLGVTPSANDYTGAAQFKWIGHSLTPRSVDDFALTMNAYHNGGGWKYGNTANASAYIQSSAGHAWFTAPSGTAGNAITFSQAMTLDASGNLGIGVTSPATRISVSNSRSDTAGTGWFTYTNVSETSARRGMRVDTNNAYCFDYYNGSSWSEQMRIDSSGNLLVGCTSTSFANGTHTGLFLTNNTGGDGGLAIRNTSNNTGTKVVRFFGWDGSETGSIQTYVNVTTYNTSSDYRLKNITGSLTGYKERLMSLQPKQGTWIANGSEFRGFLAHEFANPYRASVTGEKDAVDANGKPEYQGMQASSAEVMADLVALVQEQQAIIENLKARLDAANL